mmetsp:Transcript_12044/g.14974  ORF Transcript_12044/g.14974 Transcript_12044/m.14974 type:complete len:363 (-) Transcript_12044:96-1184(-)
MILCSWARRLQVLDLCGLKRVTDLGIYTVLRLLPSLTYLGITGCERVHLLDLGVNLTTLDIIGSASGSMLQVLQFNGMGTPRIGLPQGTLTFLAERSKKLVEVDISGCEQVTDSDINSLAEACSRTLKCFGARGCSIANASIFSLATHCQQLIDLDISACFSVNSEGIISLCPRRVFRHGCIHTEEDGKGCPELRSLKMAYVPLSDSAIVAIGGSLRNLLLLDVNNCSELSAEVLVKMVQGTPSLIELDARNTVAPNTVALHARKRLAIVNQKRCSPVRDLIQDLKPLCSVKCQSQRRKPSLVYHCIDCNLTPCWNRGMCSGCATSCHQGHEVYLGSMARFYCDCGFGFSSAGNKCQTLGLA